MHAQRVRELERVEEGVGNDRRPIVGAPCLQESADHLWPEHAAELVAQLYRVSTAVRGHARLHTHVELPCDEFNWTSVNERSLFDATIVTIALLYSEARRSFGVKFFCKVEWLLATVTSIIVYSDDQGESRAERHYPGNWRRPGSFAVLDLHPTVHVVTCNHR